MSAAKNIAILGAGESGTGAAILAADKGWNVLVSDMGAIKPKYKTLLDENSIKWEEGSHNEAYILTCAEVVKSPGISDKAPLIVKLKEKGIPVISEIEFAGRYTDSKMVCITGSNGKTTTTLLTYHILKNAGLDVGLAGNVGKSLAYQVARAPKENYVVELSSFQLDNMYHFKADVAILLNITPDHLDRYDYNFENYINAKFRIAQNMTGTDSLIYCCDDEVVNDRIQTQNINATLYPFTIKKKLKEGSWLENEQLIIQILNQTLTMSIYDLALQGKHNIYNSMAAGIAARIFDIRKQVVRESLSDFQNAEHRLEKVGMVHGIEFINDSKATNINSTWYALESMEKPVVWIVGGVDKGNDYSMLNELVLSKVKAIVCLGKDNKKILKAFGKKIPNIVEADTAEKAVMAAYKIGKTGDVVLLSPACASFDLFENYEDRGHQFKAAVKSL